MRKINAINLFVLSSIASVLAGSLTRILILLFTTDYFRTVEAVAWVTASSTIPFLIFGLISGVLVDRYDKKYILIFCDVGRALFMLIIVSVWIFDFLNLPSLIFLLIIFGIFDTIYQTAESSFLPELVSGDTLSKYNGYIWGASSLATMIGPAAAGIIYASTGGLWGMFINIIAYAFSIWNLAYIPNTPIYKNKINKFISDVFKDIVNGFYSILKNKVLLTSLFILLLGNFLLAPIEFLIISYLRYDLGVNSQLTGIILSLSGVAGLLGGIIAPRIKLQGIKGRFIIILSSFIMMTGSLMLIIMPSYYMVSVGLSMLSFAFSARTVYIITLRQVKANKDQLGMINSCFKFIVFGIQPLSIFVFNIISINFKVFPTLIILTVLFFVQFIITFVFVYRNKGFELTFSPTGQIDRKKSADVVGR